MLFLLSVDSFQFCHVGSSVKDPMTSDLLLDIEMGIFKVGFHCNHVAGVSFLLEKLYYSLGPLVNVLDVVIFLREQGVDRKNEGFHLFFEVIRVLVLPELKSNF